MSERRVVYNGIEMDSAWVIKIEAAQSEATRVICGEVYARVRFGGFGQGMM